MTVRQSNQGLGRGGLARGSSGEGRPIDLPLSIVHGDRVSQKTPRVAGSQLSERSPLAPLSLRERAGVRGTLQSIRNPGVFPGTDGGETPSHHTCSWLRHGNILNNSPLTLALSRRERGTLPMASNCARLFPMRRSQFEPD